jgi:mannosyltransferase
MAAGCPVIATRVGSVEKLVVHGRTGLLVEAGDSGALTSSVLRLMDSPQLSRYLAAAARAHVAAEFSARAMAEKYIGIYRDALAAGRCERSYAFAGHE